MPCACSAYAFPHRKGGGKCPGYRYVCDCGCAFNEPNHKHIPATWGYWGGDPPEDLYFCPDCGSEDFTDLLER